MPLIGRGLKTLTLFSLVLVRSSLEKAREPPMSSFPAGDASEIVAVSRVRVG